MRKNCATCKYDDIEDSYITHCSECYNMDDDPTNWEPAEHYEPDTNADRIRSMSDRDLAEFLSGKFAEVGYLSLDEEGHKMTKIQLEAIKHNLFCVFMKWLKQPAEVTNER